MSENLSDSDLPAWNWKTSRPPPELLHTPPGTSAEIESILKSSIEYLQDIFVYEDDLKRKQLAIEGVGQELQQSATVEGNLEQKHVPAEALGPPAEASPRHRRSLSAPARATMSKGKEKSVQKSPGTVPEVVSLGKHTLYHVHTYWT